MLVICVSKLPTFLEVEDLQFISPPLLITVVMLAEEHGPQLLALRRLPIAPKEYQLVGSIWHHCTPTHFHGVLGGVGGY